MITFLHANQHVSWSWLRDYSCAGQIYVEIERARLTRRLAGIWEEEGKIDAAADTLQEVAVVRPCSTSYRRLPCVSRCTRWKACKCLTVAIIAYVGGHQAVTAQIMYMSVCGKISIGIMTETW